jgi:hypothetical protein
MTSKRTTTPGWYKKRTPEMVRRQLRKIQFDADVLRAYRGDTGPLCDYLKDSDLPLQWNHREMLAELIYRRIERKRRGRPRGSDPVLNPAREAERVIVDEVRQLKLRRFGNKRVPKGGLNAVIDEVRENNADRFDGLGGDISTENIRRELKRGAKKKAKPSSVPPHR